MFNQLSALTVVLVLTTTSLYAQKTDATLQYVQQHQSADGGFRPTAKAGPSTLRATSTAVRCIKYLGGELKDKNACMNFVKSCFDAKSGGFADRAGDPISVPLTAIGLMALAELEAREPAITDAAVAYLAKNAKSFEEQRLAVAGFEAAKQVPDAIDGWLATIAKTKNADGTYGKGIDQARTTGSVLPMFLRVNKEVSKADRMAAAQLFKAAQRADGGFGSADRNESDLETTYRVMRACALIGYVPSRRESLEQYIATCKNSDGGYAIVATQASSLSGTYYALSIQKFLAGLR